MKEKHEPHSFTRKVCHWQYCAKCGLVALKNEPTQIAIKMGCGWKDKPREAFLRVTDASR